MDLTESNQPDAMRAAKYWRERETAQLERDEALAALAAVKVACAEMRFWGADGRHAATFIENTIGNFACKPHSAIGRLNGHLVQLQEMAQHTNDAVEDAFGVKPSNEPDENHLALIEAAGYRLMRAESAIERVRALPEYYDLNSGSAYAYVAKDIRDALEPKP